MIHGLRQGVKCVAGGGARPQRPPPPPICAPGCPQSFLVHVYLVIKAKSTLNILIVRDITNVQTESRANGRKDEVS